MIKCRFTTRVRRSARRLGECVSDHRGCHRYLIRSAAFFRPFITLTRFHFAICLVGACRRGLALASGPSVESKDVSKVDGALLDQVEADVYWCLTKLLDNIQVCDERGLPVLVVSAAASSGGGARRCWWRCWCCWCCPCFAVEFFSGGVAAAGLRGPLIACIGRLAGKVGFDRHGRGLLQRPFQACCEQLFQPQSSLLVFLL